MTKAALCILGLLLAVAVAPAPAQAKKTATRSQLRRAKKVVVHYLWAKRTKAKIARVVLTRRTKIRRLSNRMSFRSVRPCKCRYKFRLVFHLTPKKTVTVYSWPHGWRFANDKVSQRKDSGGFIRHLNRLFGLKGP